MWIPKAAWSKWVATLVVAAHVATWWVPASAIAQSSQDRPWAKGQEAYEDARFADAIALLKELVDNRTLAGEDLQKARELLARAYVRYGRADEGRRLFKDILRANPEWQPDRVAVPHDEKEVFKQAQREYHDEKVAEEKAAADKAEADKAAADKGGQSTPGGPINPSVLTRPKHGIASNKWLWIGGGAGVALLAVLVGGGGGEVTTPDPLPNFPGTPP